MGRLILIVIREINVIILGIGGLPAGGRYMVFQMSIHDQEVVSEGGNGDDEESDDCVSSTGLRTERRHVCRCLQIA
jgi:hypothetical protein